MIKHKVKSHTRESKRSKLNKRSPLLKRLIKVRSYTRGRGTKTNKPEPKIIKEIPAPRKMYYDGVKGNKYEQTRNLPLKVIAKMVKAEIKNKYPHIKVSVSTKHFSGGREINVKITSYPKHFLVRRVIYPEMEGLPEDKIPRHAWSWTYDHDAKEVVDGIEKIVDAYNYNDSDIQTDYSNVSFYGDVDFAWELMKAEEERIGLR